MATPHAALRQMIDSYRITQMICVAAELCIADHLAAGPRTSLDLANTTSADAPSLYRLLRALASLGIVERLDGERFAATPLSGCLRADVPGSLRTWALHSGRLLYDTWTHLDHSVATGDTAFDYSHGMNVWEYRERNPEAGRTFHAAMAATTLLLARAVVGAYRFPASGTVIDVGGGKGALMQAILEANSGTRGIVFDVKAAVEEADSVIASAGLKDRCQAVAGDFFESVPAGGDSYILSRILHDWPDEASIRILRTLGRAMAGKGTLLIIERGLDDENPNADSTLSDMNMLVMTGGLERTTTEYRKLLEAAGFTLSRMIPTDAPVNIIEAVPA